MILPSKVLLNRLVLRKLENQYPLIAPDAGEWLFERKYALRLEFPMGNKYS
jgi:hypothetical protein